jgi:hypothetical protein
VLSEQRRHPADRGGRLRQQGVTVARVADRVREHLAELPAAVIAQQQQPCVDRPGHGRGESARAGDEIEALAPEMLDRGSLGRRALPHEDDGARGIGRGREDAHEVAARAVQVRLHDVQHEASRDGRVEGVPAALEHRLRTRGGQPVRGGGHPEGACQCRARRERRGRRVRR